MTSEDASATMRASTSLPSTSTVVTGPIADSVLSVGPTTASPVDPREVFRLAIAVGAIAVLIAHNHPNSDVAPSPEDLDVTRHLAEIGCILGVTPFDHVVWARSGVFHSIRESHLAQLSPER